MDQQLDIQHEEHKSYELTLCVKDSNGNATGETKTKWFDNASSLAEWWWIHQGKPKRKRRRSRPNKKNKKQHLPSGKEADKILQNLYEDKEKAN